MRTAILGLAAVVGLMAFEGSASAQAVSVGVYGPRVGFGIGFGGGYYAPAPAYYAPATVVAQPAAVVSQPGTTVVSQPAVVVAQPAPAVVVAPGAYYYGPAIGIGFGYRGGYYRGGYYGGYRR